MSFPEFRLHLPAWVDEEIPHPLRIYATLEERMDLVIRLARRNVDEGTGGPFAAAVFELPEARLVVPGVNLVVSSGCSVAHAEIVALTLAQQRIGSHLLQATGATTYQLVTTTEPCAMCLGAVPWSGISSLICGARDEDAREVGFDEGSKPSHWVENLENRGIEVIRDVGRAQARQVLRRYVENGGIIYNGRR